MKYLLILVLTLTTFLSFSQELDTKEWCPVGATWIYSLNSNDIGSINNYRLYKFEKDTFVNNLNLKKIVKYSFSVLNDADNTRSANNYIDYSLFYKSNDSIFYINSSNNLELLYTFSTSLGTSWLIKSTTNSLYGSTYPVDCDSLFNVQDQVTINSIKFDTIDNNIYQYTLLSSSFSEWEYGAIYKNIGPSKSFFAAPIYTPYDSCVLLIDYTGYNKENKLVSYYDSQREYSFNRDITNAHFLTTKIDNIRLNGDYNIYPNPVVNVLHTDNEIGKYEIIGLTGSKITNTYLMNKNNIDVSRLLKGVYYIKLFENNNFHFVKFLKK